MLKSTVAKTNCPSCASALSLQSADKGADILKGSLECKPCKLKFPILAGVAVIVEDVETYLIEHVKGISKLVADSEIPKEFLKQYRQAKEEIQEEHIEEDLEAERVISLYFMNQYLDAASMRALFDDQSPLIAQLIEKYWDHGPFSQIEKWAGSLAQKHKLGQTIELGCGVGGLARLLQPHTENYLGVDSSFASIALARHLTLGAPYAGALRVPTDLLHGPVSKKVDTSKFRLGSGAAEHTDFVVADLTALPIKPGSFDAAIALNAIDMLPEPAALPALQFDLLKVGGVAFQSCPYIWHESVARELRETLPKHVHTSAEASEWLYEQSGFKICEKVQHLPWLFFKHQRQLETYSVHLFYAAKN
jgi:SAM-dependent methyltransferase/uncharacterized protein YbaR (Trm112 family)